MKCVTRCLTVLVKMVNLTFLFDKVSCQHVKRKSENLYMFVKVLKNYISHLM